MRSIVFMFLLLTWHLCSFCQSVCTITRYDEETGMSQWHVTQMLQDRNGMMWFSTWNGIDRFDGYGFVNFKPRAGDGSEMLTDRIRDIRMDAGGDIYCKADNGWFHFNVHTGKFLKVSKGEMKWEGLPGKGRMAIGVIGRDFTYKDRYGTQWKFVKDGRMFYVSDGMTLPYALGTPLPPVMFYMPDRQGNLWLLTRQGVFKLTFSCPRVTMLPQEKTAAAGCLFLDGKQRYWVTTKGDATVRLYDRYNHFLGYLTPQGRLSGSYTPFPSPVYCMFQSSDGTYWLGCKSGGVFLLRENAAAGGFTVGHIANLPCNDVYNIKEDAQGRIWMATMGGGVCCVLDAKSALPSKIVSFIGRKGYPLMDENKVRFIHITSDNILLAATTEGMLAGRIPAAGDVAKMVFRLHERDPYRASSLSCNATMDILEDSRHRFFVSTESGGVCRILTDNLLADSLEFRHYNTQNGMSSDVALALKEMNGQVLIVGSNRLMTLDVDKGQFGFYGMNFFGRTCRFSEVRPLVLPDGRWLFGLHDGAFAISPDMMRKSSYVPPVVLTGIDKGGKGVDYAVTNTQRVVLSPQERTVTVYFSALDYANPAAVAYAFKMEKDEEWNYIGHSHTVSLVDLKPGTYRLQIRSTNSDGVWVDNVRVVEIIVEPSFVESAPGRILLSALLLGVIAAIIYTLLYIRRIKRQQRETLEAYLKLISGTTASGRNEDTDESGNGTDEGYNGVKERTPVQDDTVAEDRHIPRLSPADNAFMERVMAYVEANIGNSDASVNDMAEASAASRSCLNRKMKSLVGLTPADFLREARIKRACLLLETTDIAVSDIAYKCGFTDPKYFGKCFKTSVGMSPSEYRNK